MHFLVLFGICASWLSCLARSQETTPVNLLLLVPWPDNRESAGWGPGPDLIAGARVAANEVNNSTTILPGYKINLIESQHEACGLSDESIGLTNLAKYSINRNSPLGNVAAVLGLYCSTITLPLAKIAGREELSILQLTGANSPIFIQERETYNKHLWHFLQSASIYADMMIAIMDHANWKRVAIIGDSLDKFYTGIADALADAVNLSPDKALIYHGSLLNLQEIYINAAINSIKYEDVFIIFAAVSGPETARLMCKAYRNNMLWPTYVWVLADSTADFILSSSANCTKEELTAALEGTLIAGFHLQHNDTSTVLVSNSTYQDYRDKYFAELQIIANEYSETSEKGDYMYASIAYDQVWAFSIALQHTLPQLKHNNISIEDYSFGQPSTTKILETALSKVNFTGASGDVEFHNENHEVYTKIRITQVRNGTEIDVGIFDPTDPDKFYLNIQNLPKDSITPYSVVLPSSLALVTLIVSCGLVILVSINLLLMIRFRNVLVVRAASPILSLLMIIGCYFDCVPAILLFIKTKVDLNDVWASILCNIELWLGFTGVYLIVLTMLLRVMRIFHIFNHFGKITGKFWTDRSLFLVILAMSLFPSVVFAAWVPADTFTYQSEVVYDYTKLPLTAQLIGRCMCNYFWTWQLALYVPLLLSVVMLIFFAVQTRTIKRKHFKDTKKINIFVFSIAISLGVFVTGWQLLLGLKQYVYADLVSSLMYLWICLLCQVTLFVPKLFPPAYRCIRNIPEERPSNIHDSTNQQVRHDSIVYVEVSKVMLKNITQLSLMRKYSN